MKKIDKKTKNFVFAIVVLSLILVLSIIYNFIGGFVINGNINSYLELGDSYTFKLNELGIESEAFLVDGSTILGATTKQKIQIKLPNIAQNNLILRTKITFLGKNVQIAGYDLWAQSGDYYVYNGEKTANQTIGLCEEIVIENVPLKSDTLYYLMVCIEYINEAGLDI